MQKETVFLVFIYNFYFYTKWGVFVLSVQFGAVQNVRQVFLQ